MSPRRRSLAASLWWAAVPAVLAILVVAATVIHLVARQRLLRDVERRVAAFAEYGALALESFFEARDRDLQMLTEAPVFADHYKNLEYGLLQEAETYRRQIGQYLRRFEARSRVYDVLVYAGADGRALVGLRGGLASAELRGPERGVLSALAVRPSVRLLVDEGDERRIYDARTLFDDAGRRRGALLLGLNLGKVSEVLDRIRVGEQGQACLALPGAGPVLGSCDAGGRWLVRSAPVKGTPWEVRAAADGEEFLAPLARVRNATIGVSLTAAFLVVLILAWRIRRETRPIEDLVEGTRRLAAGELDYRFGEPDTAELASLARAFNEMAGSLQSRNQELERRIRQLTALKDLETAALGRPAPDEILRTCLQTAVEGLGFDRGVLYWVEDREVVGRLVHRTESAGLTPAVFRRRRVALGSGDILARVVETREPALVADAGKHPGVNPDYVRESGTRSFILAPLCGQDRVLGVLGADNWRTGRPLTEEDRDNLMLFANATGLALENAELVRRIAESELRHRQVLDGSDEAIVGLDAGFKVSTWNRGAERILGRHAALAVGRPLRESWPSEAAELLGELLGRVEARGELAETPLPKVPLAGGRRDLVASVHPTAGGGWSLVLRDETDKRLLQSQLIQAEKLSAVGKLISSIAHELNNPLATVVGYADLVQRERASKSIKEDLAAVREGAVRCRRIIDSLLAFVRKDEPKRVLVSPHRVFERALALVGHRIKEVGRIEVVNRIPPGLRVVADPNRLEQVAVNLLSNACDAMKGDDGPRAIEARGEAAGDRVRISVEDSGPGVPEDKRSRVFDAFYTTKPEGEGTGLGLAICRDIVREQGGELACEGSELGGARFVLDLPAAPEGAREPSPAPKTEAAKGGLKVLVVEDDADFREFLRRGLASAGHRPQAVGTLAEARRKLGRGAPDVVLADWRLPDGSGLELHDGARGLPFLFMTGDVLDPALAAEFRRRGARCLAKPFELAELLEAVGELTGPARGRRR